MPRPRRRRRTQISRHRQIFSRSASSLDDDASSPSITGEGLTEGITRWSKVLVESRIAALVLSTVLQDGGMPGP